MAFFDTATTAYILVWAFILGAVLGSAMNCLAMRIVRHEKWGGKSRSKCPSCGHTLGALDLIPVVSWLALGGKCRYCKKEISPRYIIAEVILGAAFVLLALKAVADINEAYSKCLSLMSMYQSLGFTPEISPSELFKAEAIGCGARLLCSFIFAACGLALSLADLETFEIPDRFIVIPAIARIICVFFFGGSTCLLGDGTGLIYCRALGLTGAEAVKPALLTLADSLITGLGFGIIFLLLSLFMDRLLKKDSLGGGDIKLFALAGLYLRPGVMLVCVLFSCLMGIIPGLLAMKKASEAEAAEKAVEMKVREDKEAGKKASAKADSKENPGRQELKAADPDPEDEIPRGAFPFGPAISAAALISILYGEYILSAYLRLTGLA